MQGFWQVVEGIVIAGLILGQLYFLFKVLNRTWLMSQFMPYKSVVHIGYPEEEAKEKEMREREKMEAEKDSESSVPSNVLPCDIRDRNKYFGKVSKLQFFDSYYFNIQDLTTPSKAVAVVLEDQSETCRFIAVSMTKSEFETKMRSIPNFDQMFIVRYSNDSTPLSKVDILRAGFCEEKGYGWVIKEKCVIRL